MPHLQPLSAMLKKLRAEAEMFRDLMETSIVTEDVNPAVDLGFRFQVLPLARRGAGRGRGRGGEGVAGRGRAAQGGGGTGRGAGRGADRAAALSTDLCG